jgi:hypothetical protein
MNNVCVEPKPCNGGFDLGILVQSSSRGVEDDFNIEKNAISEMVGRLNVKLDQVHVGLLLYSQRVKLYNSLKNSQQRTKSSFIEKVQDLPFVSYTYSPLYDGLMRSSTELFNQKRSYLVGKVAVLFNDAKSNPVSTNLTDAANILKRDLNVEIVVVGVGNDVSDIELNQIASHPSNVIKVPTYEDLYKNLDLITQTVCTTNARMSIDSEEYIRMGKNEFRYYKTSLTGITSMFLQIELTESRGKVNLFYSYEDRNPLIDSFKTSQQKTSFNEQTKVITNYFLIPNYGLPEIYFTIQSLEDSEVLVKVYEADL